MKKVGREKKIPKRALKLVNDSSLFLKFKHKIFLQKKKKHFFTLLQWFRLSQYNKNMSLMHS